MKSSLSVLAAVLALAAAAPAGATQLDVHYSGMVAAVFGPFADGVAAGDLAQVSARFDTADLVDITDAANALFGTSYVDLKAAKLTGPGEFVLISVGPNHFTGADQIGGDPFGIGGGPHVLFNGGAFFGVDFFGVNQKGSAFVTSGAAPEPFQFVGGNFVAPGVEGPSYGGFFDFKAATFAAAPEPASWALMIGGFGLAGTTLRRRRAAASAG